MKLFFILAMAISSLTARAEGTDDTRQTEILSRVIVNESATEYMGRVELDFAKSEVTLQIFHDPCRRAAMDPDQPLCNAPVREIAIFQAPIQSVTRSCGSVIYRGMRDDTPQEGLRVAIEAIDHRKRLCKNVVPSRFIVHASLYDPFSEKVTRYQLMQ